MLLPLQEVAGAILYLASDESNYRDWRRLDKRRRIRGVTGPLDTPCKVELPTTAGLEFIFRPVVKSTMPEISRFLGIVIRMYFNDHNPPHFHVAYNEFEASVLIETLGILEGRVPPKVLSLTVEWASQHQAELLENWESIRTSGSYRRIEPLT